MVRLTLPILDHDQDHTCTVIHRLLFAKHNIHGVYFPFMMTPSELRNTCMSMTSSSEVIFQNLIKF